jgi:hypothetical protein
MSKLKAIRNVPVRDRLQAAAEQYGAVVNHPGVLARAARSSALGFPLADVTWRWHHHADDKTETVELIGLGQMSAACYGPCLVVREPGRDVALQLIPLTQLRHIAPAG